MSQPATPAPLLRRGPRPLLLHLTLAWMRSSASLAGLMTGSAPSSAAWPLSNPAAFATIMARRMAAQAAPSGAGAGPDGQFALAVFQELARADRALIAGIAAYRRHPYTRSLPEPPTVWQEGDSRLLDYTLPGAEAGKPVLLVPSLVNRAYVLDLAPGASLLRFLAAQGFRPLLLDWGWPGAVERGFTLTDYIAGRLERAAVAALALTGKPAVLAGYCMGGTMAVAAAQRRPDLFAALALFAAPWDFFAHDGGAQGRALAALLPLLEPLLAFNATLPVDALQALFAGLDPYGIAEKYRGFARLDPASARAERFVALEDWLNDGVPLSAPVARECLEGFYGRNDPANLNWRIAGQVVDPAGITMPAFVAVPARDRIVPPEGALALAAGLRHVKVHQPSAGHIGMAAGATAERALWRPFTAWLSTL